MFSRCYLKHKDGRLQYILAKIIKLLVVGERHMFLVSNIRVQRNFSIPGVWVLKPCYQISLKVSKEGKEGIPELC